jgi:hypothetical protein
MALRYFRAQPCPPLSNHGPAGIATRAVATVTIVLITPASPGVRSNSCTIGGST